MTQDERAYLTLFESNTYGLEIPFAIAKSLEAKGWVECLPPVLATRQYGITEAGKIALQGYYNENRPSRS